MPQIVYVPYSDPDPEGSGGRHRSYQIQNDLFLAFDPKDREMIKLKRGFDKESKLRYVLKTTYERLGSIQVIISQKLNPQDMISALIDKSPSITRSLGWISIDQYKNQIVENGKPKVCLIDHPFLVEVARYNQKNAIKNIYCPNDLLSFSTLSNRLGNKKSRRLGGINWLVEQEFLALCDEYLMISLVEKHFLHGLGLPASFYPYLPVGQVRERLVNIRESRSKNKVDNNLIIMIGSVFWGPIGDGFRWVLKNIKEAGLPEGKRLIVAGKGAEILSIEFGSINGVEVRGRLDQEELDALFRVAGCMLIPQRSGFGAVTRIPEMACSGIPCITTEHAAAAINIPPGVQIAKDYWSSWKEVMVQISAQSLANTLAEYEKWEYNQPNPLTQVVEKYLT